MDLFTPVFQHTNDYLWLAVTLSATGAVLVIVNVSAHAIQEHLTKQHNDKFIVRNNLKPVLKSAELTLRALITILVQPRPDDIDEAQYKIASLRLTHFLASIRLFQRNTYNLAGGEHLEEVENYLDQKIPMALRGRIYGHRVLTPELQELLSCLVTDGKFNATPVDLDEPFMRKTIDQDDDRKRAYNAATEFFRIPPHYLNEECNLVENDLMWSRYVALCHLAIYILDFVANFTDSPQWEEYRVYFVNTIKEWSGITAAHKRNKIYLYELQDLNNNKYITTFHDSIFVKHSILKALAKAPYSRDFFRKQALGLRGQKFKQRHHPKFICNEGVTVNAKKDTVFCKYGGSRPDIRRHLISVYLNRLI